MLGGFLTMIWVRMVGILAAIFVKKYFIMYMYIYIFIYRNVLPASREQGDTQLVQQSQTLNAEDRELLNIYHHSFDDEKVDINLIMALVTKIHTSSNQEG